MAAWTIAGIVILVIAFGAIFLLFTPLARLAVAKYDQQLANGKLTVKEHADILANTRDSLLKAGGGVILLLGAVGTVGTLIYTAQTARTSQIEAAAAQAETRIGYDGQVTTAVDQLGSGNEDERIGGVYALERVMNDSPADQSAIVEILTAYVREHSGPRPDSSNPSADIQTALTVIARRNPAWDGNPVDLSGAYLYNAELEGADFADANLSGAFMGGIQLEHANLKGADLGSADLSGSDLDNALLNGANLGDEVDLSGASLVNTDLQGADVKDADFSGTDLKGANLQGVDLRTVHGLTKQQVASAKTNDSTLLPPGV